MATWRLLISEALHSAGDSWDDVVSCTLTEDELDVEFDDGYGGSQGKPFTLWTMERVYFPVVYDGAEWVGFTWRNPNGKPTNHQGGE